MNIRCLFFLLGILLVNASVIHAQNKNSDKVTQDSLLHRKLNEQFDKIQQLAAERLADSLRTVDLENQVSRLS